MKVLFFDYWTKGIHNFVRIHRSLAAYGIPSQLLHAGSWRDRATPPEECIEGIWAEDVRKYGGDLAKALDSLRPTVVVMLNTTLTLDRIINRLCRSRGVKTVYLMHGIKPIGADLDAFIRHQDRHWSISRRLQKVPKYIALTALYLKTVAASAPRELFSPCTYGHFVQLLISPGAVHERPWRHKDIYCDNALVYANIYRDALIRETGYPPERVTVVGNPNLDDAISARRQTPDRRANILSQFGMHDGRTAVLYIEDAFVEQGIGGWTEATRQSVLREVASAVNAAGMDLIIKMHPASKIVPTMQTFELHPHVHVVSSAELPDLVLACVATVGHVSTTLMLPVVLNRPLIVPTWVPGVREFGYYLEAGAAIEALSPARLTEILTESPNLRPESTKVAKFVEDYVTWVDGGSTARITEAIRRLGGGVISQSVSGVRMQDRVTIFVEALSALQGGGQTYLKNLFNWVPSDIRAQARIVALIPFGSESTFNVGEGVELISSRVASRNLILRLLWLRFVFPGVLRRLDARVLFSPGGFVPVFGSWKTAVTFQNMLPFTPEERKRYPFGYTRARLAILRAVQSRSFLLADQVIFISEFAKSVIDIELPNRRGRSVVIPHGVLESFRAKAKARPALPLPEKYVAYVSILNVYKAQLEVVQAWHLLRQQLDTPDKLVLVGPAEGAYAEQVRALIAHLGLEKEVLIVGNVPYGDLPALYQGATVNLFASSCENCPNILLEALSAGRPVLTSDYPPMPEFAKDGAMYFDPYSPQDLAEKLQSILSSDRRRAELGGRAAEIAAGFDWRQASAQTWRTLADLCIDAKLEPCAA